jgi:hypothetical protein
MAFEELTEKLIHILGLKIQTLTDEWTNRNTEVKYTDKKKLANVHENVV